MKRVPPQLLNSNLSDSRKSVEQLDKHLAEIAGILRTLKDPTEKKRLRAEARVMLARRNELRQFIAETERSLGRPKEG